MWSELIRVLKVFIIVILSLIVGGIIIYLLMPYYVSNKIDSKLAGDDANEESDVPIKRQKGDDPGDRKYNHQDTSNTTVNNDDDISEKHNVESKSNDDDFDSGFID